MSEVLPTTEARSRLNRIVAGFDAGDREPVFIGPHRRPVAVLLSAEAYRQLLDAIDDLTIAEQVRARTASDDGRRLRLEELAEAIGQDPPA